ncbi:hypothetical protein D9M70_407300 [compost metagenome]
MMIPVLAAASLLDTAKAMKQSLDTDRTKVGRIRIGVMDTVIHTWMSALVAELTESYPQVEIELVADTALNQREQRKHPPCTHCLPEP